VNPKAINNVISVTFDVSGMCKSTGKSKTTGEGGIRDASK
jgi:hypothetical protein